MRTIDGDSVAEKLFMDDEYNNGNADYYEGIKDAIKAINREPTVYPIDEIVDECRSCYDDNCRGCRFSGKCGEFFNGIPCEWDY